MKVTVEPVETKYIFRPEMVDVLPDLGAQGMTLAQMASHLCIPKRIFKSWVTPGNKAYIPDLGLAFEEAQTHCLAGWERLGEAAAMGKLPNHAAGTFKLMVSSQFPEYRPSALEAGSEASGSDSDDKIVISEDTTPAKAAVMYREAMKRLKAGKS